MPHWEPPNKTTTVALGLFYILQVWMVKDPPVPRRDSTLKPPSNQYLFGTHSPPHLAWGSRHCLFIDEDDHFPV